MGNGSEPRTRDEERPPRPGGPEEEQSPGPGGTTGEGEASESASESAPGSGWAADPNAGPEHAGGPVANGDHQPEPETGSDQTAGGQTSGRGGDEPARSVEVERDEYLDALRRLQADFENYRKRVAKQQVESAERGARALVDKLLPVLDVLDLAAAHLGDPTSDDGRALVQATALLNDVLTKEGLERIDLVGGPFDPSVHEAVGQVAADEAGEVGESASPSAGTPGAPETVGDRSTAGGGDGNAAAVGGVAPDGSAVADRADGSGADADADAGRGASDGSAGTGSVGSDSAGGGGHDVIVAQVMRAGYRWKGAVVRPAMVMVRG